MLFSLFASHVSCDVFNLTSFAIISDPFVSETVNMDMNEEEPFDRVVVDEHADVYARMHVINHKANAISIMINNDVAQTKYFAWVNWVDLGKDPSVDDDVHIVIENVTQNMGIISKDEELYSETSPITINGRSNYSGGTWTSTILPENVTVELNCKVVDVDGDIECRSIRPSEHGWGCKNRRVTMKCESDETWSDSVMNRMPLFVDYEARYLTNHVLFDTGQLITDGFYPEEWDGITRFSVTGEGSTLIIGDQFAIYDLPESFVNHWLNMGAVALMGNSNIMLLPRE